MSLYVFVWGHSFDLPEASDKVALGTESQNLTDLGSGILRVAKHIAGCIDPAAQDIVRYGSSSFFLKNS